MIVNVDDSPDVIALIPTLGTDRARLERCLAALGSQDAEMRLGILVVSNTATSIGELPGATVVVAGLNLGWAGGLSLARAVADAPLLWLVQDDLTPDDSCLSELLGALDEDPGLAVVAPVVIDSRGMVVPYSCGGVLDADGDITEWLPSSNVRPAKLTDLDRLDYIPSRGMLVRTADWDRVGGMDAGFYPVFWADIDFCTELRRAGRRFAIRPSAVAQHELNASTTKPYAEFLFARNRARFLAGWTEPVAAPALHPRIPNETLLQVAVGAASALQEIASLYSTAVNESAALRPMTDRAVALQQEVDALQTSTSWRVTAPLRALRRVARR